MTTDRIHVDLSGDPAAVAREIAFDIRTGQVDHVDLHAVADLLDRYATLTTDVAAERGKLDEVADELEITAERVTWIDQEVTAARRKLDEYAASLVKNARTIETKLREIADGLDGPYLLDDQADEVSSLATRITDVADELHNDLTDALAPPN